jgi:hypothetical protein
VESGFELAKGRISHKEIENSENFHFNLIFSVIRQIILLVKNLSFECVSQSQKVFFEIFMYHGCFSPL